MSVGNNFFLTHPCTDLCTYFVTLTTQLRQYRLRVHYSKADMRPSLLWHVAALAATTLTPTASALNILMNNDDGFGSANLRALYSMLVDAGHDVVVVAPATQQSAQGGRSSFSDYGTLQEPTQYDIVQAGAPAVGQDPTDSNIWYYNGTPAACTFVALDWVIPQYYDNRTIDLMVSGPNFGNNL